MLLSSFNLNSSFHKENIHGYSTVIQHHVAELKLPKDEEDSRGSLEEGAEKAELPSQT